MTDLKKLIAQWKELMLPATPPEPITVGELIDHLAQEGYPVVSEKYAGIRDQVITSMRLGEQKITSDTCEMSITMGYVGQKFQPSIIPETKMPNTTKSVSPLLIDVVEDHLKSLPAGQVIQLSTTVDDIKSEVVKTHIVRTSRGPEEEIVSFTAFHINCKTPDHEKTNLLNRLLGNVYRRANSKSNIATHLLLSHLATCVIDPVIGG